MTDWQIDGSTVSTTVDETLAHDSVELVWRSANSVADSHLRPLETHSGKVRKDVAADGSFEVVDLANGSNTVCLTPHSSRSTVHREGDYLVADYTEEQINQQGSTVRVTVEFVHASGRGETASDLSQSATTSEWLFSFTTGTVATPRVRALTSRPGKTGISGNQIEVFLTASQARAVAEGPNREDAVIVRSFDDGQNAAVDTSPSRNTASIATPSAATSLLTDGQYIVADWELTYLNNDWYRWQPTLWSA